MECMSGLVIDRASYRHDSHTVEGPFSLQKRPTVHVQTAVSGCNFSCYESGAPIWPTEFTGNLVLRNCCPFEGGSVGQLMCWQAACLMMVVFRLWSLAVQILVRERLKPATNHEKAPV